MARTYMKPIYGFPLATFLFSLSSFAMIALIGELQYIVAAQCTEGFIAHCPQGALGEAMKAGRAAFSHMAVALWLYGLAMLILAGAMGPVELALACHIVAVVAVIVGSRAQLPAEQLVRWMGWSMMLTTTGTGVFEGVWYGKRLRTGRSSRGSRSRS